MRIQVSTDYAVRILRYLHKAEEKQEPLQTAMTITIATGLTYPFFIKIANQLKKSNLVSAVQGRNGGYVLGKPADQITIYDVFLATEGEMWINHCLKGDHTHCSRDGFKNCALRKFFGCMQQDMIAKMTAQTIRDLDRAS